MKIIKMLKKNLKERENAIDLVCNQLDQLYTKALEISEKGFSTEKKEKVTTK